MAAPASPAKAVNSFAKLPVGAKLGILAVILGALGALYYIVLHMPLADDLATADTQYQTLIQQREQAKQRQQEFLQLRTELDTREASDRQNMRILPQNAEMAAFLQDLNRLAELSGLHVKLVEPRPDEASTFFVKLPVNLELEGRYHQLAKFFNNVSRLERAINMENIELSNPRLDGEDVVLNVSVLATTFRRAPDAAPAPAPGAPGAPAAPAAPPGRSG